MKRANYQGTKQKDGRWKTTIMVTTVSGAKKRKPIYGQTHREMRENLEAFLLEGKRTSGADTIYRDLIDAWDAWFDSEDCKLRSNSVRSYRDSLKHIKEKWQLEVVDKVPLQDITKWLKTLDGAVHDHVRVVLGTMLNWGRLNGYNTTNPIAGVRIAHKAENIHARCSEQELEANLSYMFEEYHPFLRFIANTGLRPWDEGIITDRSQVHRFADESYVIVGDSKTEAGRGRKVPITDRYVLDHIDSIESGPLFPGLTYPKVRSAWRRSQKYSGNDCDIYGLRSLAISKWCETEDLDVVMARAGHKDPKVTMMIYNEVRDERRILGDGIKDGIKLADFMQERA